MSTQAASRLYRHRPQFGKLLLVALAYFATGELGLSFPTQYNDITLFWLPTGVGVAALWRWGTACWPGVFLGCLLVESSLSTPLLLSLGISVGDTLAPLLTVWLLRRWQFDPSFTRQRDLLALIAAAALGMLLSAAIGVGLLQAGNLVDAKNSPLAWLHWWLGDTVGVLLAGPLLLSLSRASLDELLRRPANLLLCGLLMGAAAWLTFFSNTTGHILPLAFLPIPLVLWAALRFGVTGSSLSVLTLSLLSTIGTAMNKGVFGSLPAEESMYLAWLYMFTVTLIGLMTTTMLGERKKIEDSLRHLNTLLKETQAVAKTGSWRLDLHSNELIWSEETYRIFGIPPGTPLNYARFLAQVHPDDRARVDAAWQAALDGSPYRIQHRIVVDGETRWVEERAQRNPLTQSEVHVVTGSVQDITENKIAQQRAEQSEARYKALLQQAADAMFLHDFDARILEVNQLACDTLGYSHDELCQMTLADIVPGFELATRRSRWEQLEPAHPVIFTTTHRRKNGSSFPVEVRLVALSIDNKKMIMALASDITERQRIESALQESEMRYRNFAEKLPLGIVITQNGLIKYINQASTDLIGYSTAELLDQPFLPLVHETDRPWLRDLHQRRMQGEKVSSPYVVRMVRKDGQVRQWEMHASTIEWEGKLSGFGICSDITERILLEEKLRNSLHQLEEKELAKTRFLAAAGHDLRQPIAAANLFVDALKLTSPAPQQAKLIERLDQSMDVFSSLLERLLDISKFDAGLIKPEFATYNMAELFNWLEQNFAQTALDKQLSFRLSFPRNMSLRVRTDIGLLQSVLMNLVSNAIKFTARGGILIGARRRGNKVLLQVWDTGIGIADGDLGHIFDEFYQVANPQRNREAGLGLGLSICQRAISLLGEKVTCRSRPGSGSVFELSLPLNGEPEETRRQSAAHMPAEIGDERLIQGKRVVVLEDDLLVADGLLNLLQGLEAEVRHFHNAEEALLHPDIFKADFFVADYALGGELSGLEFLRTVQQRIPTPIRAVVLTGETSSQFMHSVADSPWQVLHKPVNYAQLLSSLKQA